MAAVKLNDYEVIETIGLGYFGYRKKVARKADGQLFEWQQIDYRFLDDCVKEVVICEVNSLKNLRHPNVVLYEDGIVERKTSTFYVITELCQNYTLQNIIDTHKKCKQLVNEGFIWCVLDQLSQALSALNSLRQDPYNSQVYHRCLKPSSVFLNKKRNAIKIGNFSLGLNCQQRYPCPELLCGVSSNEKSDVWSMGCITYELCTLTKPFEGLEEESNLDFRLENVSFKHSQDMVSILKFILTPDHETRPSALMVLHHPIMRLKKLEQKTNITSVSEVMPNGVLETDFPLSAEETLTDPSSQNEPKNIDISLNHYLSMMGNSDESYVDDVDIESIENGTALPKASSSFYDYSRPALSCETASYGDISKQSVSSRNLTERAAYLEQLEGHLQRWAKMLEEKELELSHKEKRLRLWQDHLEGMNRSRQATKSLLHPCGPDFTRSTAATLRRHSLSQTDTDTTTDPSESKIQPTVVRLEPSKIRNPFSSYSSRHVRFMQPAQQNVQGAASNRNLPNHAALSRIKDEAGVDCGPFMENKSLPNYKTIARPTLYPMHHAGKENGPSQLAQPATKRSAHGLRTAKVCEQTVVLSSELKAKLKSHNLPGLR